MLLSGYGGELYDTALKGWERHERRAIAGGGTSTEAIRDRVEVLWVKRAV